MLWGLVHHGHTDEIASLSAQTVERWPDPKSPFAADAVATAATARVVLGDPGGAYALAERTLDAIGASGTAPVTLRRAMAYAARALDDRPLAMRLFADVSARARERGLVGLALEADVSRAQLMADDVGLEPAIELAESARREAAAAGSAVNEVWAQSFVALFHLRQDTPSGFAEVHAALEAARRIDYPAAISLNLRSLAWGSIRAGRPRDAAEALTELFDGIVARDGVAAAGGALHTTVELLREIGSPAWPALAATAVTLPIIGLTGGTIDRLEEKLPEGGAQPLSRRDAIVLARRELRDYLAEALLSEPPEPPTRPGPPAAASPGPIEARLVDHGDFWELDFAGRTVHAKASKGVADLARLLAAPGREVHCLELMGGSVEQASTGEVLDQTARAPVRGAHPRPAAGHRRRRGRQRLRPGRSGPRRARHAGRPPHRGARARRPHPTQRQLGRAGPLGGHAASALDDPALGRRPSRAGPPSRGFGHDRHVLRLPAGASGGLARLSEAGVLTM